MPQKYPCTHYMTVHNTKQQLVLYTWRSKITLIYTRAHARAAGERRGFATLLRTKILLYTRAYYLAMSTSPKPQDASSDQPKGFGSICCSDLECNDENRCDCVMKGTDSNEPIKCNRDCRCYKNCKTGKKTCQNS